MIRRSTLRGVVLCSTATLAIAAMAGPALARGVVPPEGSEDSQSLTFIQVVGLYVLLPLAIFVVITLAVLGPSMGRGARHRTGQGLDSGPVWVGGPGDDPVLNEPVLGDPGTDTSSRNLGVSDLGGSDAGQRGGASGRW